MVKNELLVPGQDSVSYQEQKPIITTYHPVPIMHRQPFTLLHHCYPLSTLLHHQTTTVPSSSSPPAPPLPTVHRPTYGLHILHCHVALTVLRPRPVPSPTKSVYHLPPLLCTTSSPKFVPPPKTHLVNP